MDACVALLGACWAGATYVPIGLKQPEERILALLAQCDLSAIVTDDEGIKLLSERLRAVAAEGDSAAVAAATTRSANEPC